MYAFYDTVTDKIIECALPDSVLDQALIDPQVRAKEEAQLEARQALESAQSDAKDVDDDNPGAEGYLVLFDLLAAWNDYFRSTRDLLKTEGAIYESHGCDLPAFPEWWENL